MIINHNLPALNTYNRLSANNMATAKSLEKLSSGFRINRAGDDAAGLAISEKMRGQIRGLDMATKNSQDMISLIQTAEGALTETHSILQRMRELAVQSGNDTNTNDDRKEIAAEVKQLISEVDRIGNTTEFNTKKLLNGEAKGVMEAVSGSFKINQNSKLSFTAAAMASMATAMGKAAVSAVNASNALDGAYMLIRIKDSDPATSTYTADDFRIVNSAGKQLTITSAVSFGIASLSNTGITFAGSNMGSGVNNVAMNFQQLNARGSQVAGSLNQMKVGESMTFVFKKFEKANNNLDESVMGQIGANAGQTVFISMKDMRSQALGIDKIDVGTKFGAQTAIEVVNNALTKVSSQRSLLGAMQNRLEHTINNLTTSSENLSAAESRIRDVDMAKEMMSFQKNNILQQAATAMLAQANQQPQGVLQLLR